MVIVGFITLAQSISAQEINYLKHECQVRNITLQNIPDTNVLEQLLVGEDRFGVLNVHPFDMADVGWTTFTQALTDQSGYTYVYVGSKESRFSNSIHYRYQQQYNSVPVEDGSLTLSMISIDETSEYQLPPHDINPCDGIVVSFSPNVYENITLNTVPTISEQSIDSYLPNECDTIFSTTLRIVNNLSFDCTYNLAWKINYESLEEGFKVIWIDAHSGSILENRVTSRNVKEGLTADHGFKNMPDSKIGGRYHLKNDRLSVHDYTSRSLNLGGSGNGWRAFEDSRIPRIPEAEPSYWEAAILHPANLVPSYVHGHAQSYQLFWMADSVLETYENELDISWPFVLAVYSEDFNGGEHVGTLPDGKVGIAFGDFYDPSPSNGYDGELVEFDIIAHELGHAVVFEFTTGDQIESLGLSEGIGDMFGVFIEAKIENPININWVIGEDAIDPSITRDLENPNFDCFVNIATSDVQWDRGESLGHWFYLCVKGKSSAGIPAMNIKEVLDLIIESMPFFGSNPDYDDLMEISVDLAEDKYGTCSSQFKTILRAWEEICVPTGHRMADPTEPCAELHKVTSTYSFVCEENNVLEICLSTNSGINTSNTGTWWVVGKNSVNFESVRGMQGNVQSGGGCIDIDFIPDMPYYPQYITVEYWNSAIGEVISLQVEIRDCDKDDPTCEDYHNIQPLSSNSGANHIQNYDDLTLKAYDVMGNELNITQGDIQNGLVTQRGIVILTYWNKSKELIDVKKTLFLN